MATRAQLDTVQTQFERARDAFSVVRRRGPWKDALRRRMLALADLGAALAAAAALAVVEPTGAVAAVWAAMLAPLWILLAKVSGLYGSDHVRLRHQTVDEFWALFHWLTLSVALTSLVLTMLPGSLVTPGGCVAMWAGGFAAAVTLRTGARAIWRRSVPAERGLVVGHGPLADALTRKLALESGHHLEVVAQVTLEEVESSGAASNGGGRFRFDELEELADTGAVERVILALHDLDEDTLSRVTAICRSHGVKLSVAPPLRAMLGTAVQLTHLAELPLIEFRTGDPSRSTMLLKRVADTALACIALVALSPLLVLVAVAIKIDSRGPAFYRQRRAGQHGRPFSMLKFRTMVRDADRRLHEVVAMDDLAEPMFKVRQDPRVTRLGRFLRRWSIDELPQLFNVLLGHMSLVGPRPEELWLVERYAEAERFRLEMRPGITGAMQVHGRGELTFQERLAVEREYVENYSVRKDIHILLRTLAAVLQGKGAY